MMADLVTTWRDNQRYARNLAAGEIIPTWQERQEQPHQHDFERFFTDGYAKNGLIYTCIREIATSFAGLTPIIERDHQKVEDHRLLDLMRSPNTYQEGHEFAEELATHYEAAGNVFIHKVRQSANRDRRREFAGFPVQELSLIRPDYVTIQPGRTREQDTFLVTVGGQVRQRIPQQDMIHLHTVNLTNDFYGLSPIALLVREGSIDLEMTDFELAFFRNAGVPMGLLSVKGRTTPDDIAEIKNSFKRAYQGFRRWWDLLVLNADNATYQQLGLNMDQLEMDKTRTFVEVRICSVFGIPPVIVGARSGVLSAANPNTYEGAQHAFWAETMVPKTRRIAGAFQRDLMGEFATSADRGAKFTYDFTEVRALQEDRSRKMREVVRMVNAGWVVNDALTANGLPEIPDGDIRILTGNQILVDRQGNVVFEKQDGAQGRNPDNPLEGSARLETPVLSAEEAVREAERLSIFERRNGYH